MNNSIINQLIGLHRPFVNVETLWTIHETDKLEIYGATHCGNHPIKIDLTTGFYNNTKMLANVSTRAFVMPISPISRENTQQSLMVLAPGSITGFNLRLARKKVGTTRYSNTHVCNYNRYLDSELSIAPINTGAQRHTGDVRFQQSDNSPNGNRKHLRG